MLNKQKIDDLLEPTVEGLGFEYVCSEVEGNILRLYVDKEHGITLDDCTKISKHINRVLDVETEITSKFSLEVSSPGASRPLVKLEHFKKFIGSKVKIKLNMPIENLETGARQKNIVGHIKAVNADNFIVISNIDFPDQSFTVAFDNISKANIVPDWNI